MTIGYVCLAIGVIVLLLMGLDYWIRMRRAADSIRSIRLNTNLAPKHLIVLPDEGVHVVRRHPFDFEKDNRYGQ